MLSILLAIVACGQPERAARFSVSPIPPNVLVVVLDDIGWTERTLLPVLDGLAAQGVTFTRAYSWPVCSPARCAMLYGVLPRRMGLGDVVSAHSPASTAPNRPPHHWRASLFDMLPAHEGALFGKWHLGRAADGAAELLSAECLTTVGVVEGGPFCAGASHWLAGNPNSVAQGPGSTGYYDWYRVDDSIVQQSHATYATAAQRDAFLAWWAATPAPRFGWLAFSSAHAPYDPPPGYSSTGVVRGDYEQVVTYLNGALASVLAAVSTANSYVVVVGDNGTPDDARPAGSPSGYWKGTTYEGGVRVPLIVAGPGILPGTSSRLVSIVDLPATLLELLGGAARGHEDSVSFADALGTWTGSPARTWGFTERYQVASCGPSCPQPVGYDDQAVIEAQWKLRRWDADGSGPGMSVDRAYYLPNDPYELAPIDPALLPQSLRDRLYAELASVPSRAP